MNIDDIPCIDNNLSAKISSRYVFLLGVSDLNIKYSDVFEWLETNIDKTEYALWYEYVYTFDEKAFYVAFKNETDAMAFKLIFR